jgi:hypothetical protein
VKPYWESRVKLSLHSGSGIVSEIGELLYPCHSLYTLSPSSYMLCSCFVLSLDVCIVTIIWSPLFVVIALWVICLTREITLAPCSSSALLTLVCFLIFYMWMWCPGLNPSVKLHALHRTVVPVGVTVLLGLCNPPHRGRGKAAKPGLLYPLVWIPCCDTVSENPGSRSRVGSIASDLES